MNHATAYLRHIGTAVPQHDLHDAYLAYSRAALGGDTLARRSFDRLVARSQIDHRYAVVPFDYYAGALPDTAARMREYERLALSLAERAVEALGVERARTATHIVVTTCTGFYAPGIDLQIIERFGLDPGIERTIVGFMGCYAALSALKLARHIVRSDANARVLVVNLELSSMHLQVPDGVEQAMAFSIFGDGCAASIVSAEPGGLALDAFSTALIPESADEITWRVGSLGFDMRLSMDVPRKIGSALSGDPSGVIGGAVGDVDIWAVHPGGRAVLDAVASALALRDDALDFSRDVLRSFGNMSSATIVFVLQRVLQSARTGSGCALAFGPGMICETMRFSIAS